jgi:hypothetical protein
VTIYGEAGITVELQGGLGNQLFGWATGLCLSKRNDSPLILNTSMLIARKFELDSFQIINDVKVTSQLLPNRRFNRFNKEIYTENSFAFDPKIINLKSPSILRGYFQSWRYFQEISGSIREALELIDPSIEYKELSKEFNKKKILCVHVRRGDYIQAKEYHGLTSKKYFDEAIQIATSLNKIDGIAVFSDDIASAKEVVSDADFYISDQELSSSAETLLLMSKNESLIGSNSSFSWWAGYLGEAEYKSRIFPRPWFAESKLDTRDLLPSNWLTIGL